MKLVPSIFIDLKVKCAVPQFVLRPGDGSEYHRNALISVFMFFQIFGGHSGIPLVILTTIFAKKIQRHPFLINFCVTWFIYATSFTLLWVIGDLFSQIFSRIIRFYAGQQTGPEPSLQLCIIQSSFVYGATVMYTKPYLSETWSNLYPGHPRRVWCLSSMYVVAAHS